MATRAAARRAGCSPSSETGAAPLPSADAATGPLPPCGMGASQLPAPQPVGWPQPPLHVLAGSSARAGGSSKFGDLAAAASAMQHYNNHVFASHYQHQQQQQQYQQHQLMFMSAFGGHPAAPLAHGKGPQLSIADLHHFAGGLVPPAGGAATVLLPPGMGPRQAAAAFAVAQRHPAGMSSALSSGQGYFLAPNGTILPLPQQSYAEQAGASAHMVAAGPAAHVASSSSAFAPPMPCASSSLPHAAAGAAKHPWTGKEAAAPSGPAAAGGHSNRLVAAVYEAMVSAGHLQRCSEPSPAGAAAGASLSGAPPSADHSASSSAPSPSPPSSANTNNDGASPDSSAPAPLGALTGPGPIATTANDKNANSRKRRSSDGQCYDSSPGNAASDCSAASSGFTIFSARPAAAGATTVAAPSTSTDNTASNNAAAVPPASPCKKRRLLLSSSGTVSGTQTATPASPQHIQGATSALASLPGGGAGSDSQAAPQGAPAGASSPPSAPSSPRAPGSSTGLDALAMAAAALSAADRDAAHAVASQAAAAAGSEDQAAAAPQGAAADGISRSGSGVSSAQQASAASMPLASPGHGASMLPALAWLRAGPAAFLGVPAAAPGAACSLMPAGSMSAGRMLPAAASHAVADGVSVPAPPSPHGVPSAAVPQQPAAGASDAAGASGNGGGSSKAARAQRRTQLAARRAAGVSPPTPNRNTRSGQQAATPTAARTPGPGTQLIKRFWNRAGKLHSRADVLSRRFPRSDFIVVSGSGHSAAMRLSVHGRLGADLVPDERAGLREIVRRFLSIGADRRRIMDLLATLEASNGGGAGAGRGRADSKQQPGAQDDLAMALAEEDMVEGGYASEAGSDLSDDGADA